MAESYSVKAILSAKDSGFSSTLKSCSSALDRIDSKISGFSFGILTGAGQKVFSAITNGVSGLVSEINSSNAAWKTFESNMGILGKSKKDISGVKKELQSFAEQTIYSSSDMASTYAQLEAVGVKSTLGLVKGFGGLAAAAENPTQAMKTLSQQATQMAGKPTVAWADFKLMMEQTPAGIAAVAKSMGMTTSQLVAKIQKGEVATNDFFEAVEKVGTSKGFSDMATQYKTAGQAMGGLQETLSNKLTPAFEVLSQTSIGSIEGIIGKIAELDSQGIADKLSKGIEKAEKYWNAFTSAFSGTKTELMEAFTAIKTSFTDLTGEFGSTESVDNFKGLMESVAGVIKKIADFATTHSDKIAWLIANLPEIAIAIKGFSIAKTVAPYVTTFAGGIASIASKVGGGLAEKLFGVSKSTDAVGTSSQTAGTSMLTSAKAFALMGVAVLAIAAGFALLALSAIQLSNAGGLAIGVMAGLVVGVAALGVGMALLLKFLAPMGAQLMPVATAMLAMGGAVVLVAAGFAILSASAIALSNAGGLAIGVMVGMVATIALLAVGAAALAPALTAGAVGLIAFGAAMVLVGTGAVLAGAALAIVSAVLPNIVAHGTAGATAIAALGAAMIVFAAGATLAGVASVALGAGLVALGAGAVVATAGVVAFGAGIVVASAGMLAMVAALKLVSSQMKDISKNAKTTQASLKSMQSSIKVVESGLNALGSKAKSALNTLKSAFTNTASEAKTSGTKVGTNFATGMQPGLLMAVSNTRNMTTMLKAVFVMAVNDGRTSGLQLGMGFTQGMQSGMSNAPSVASSIVSSVTSKLRSGYSGAYSAGAYISSGFAAGMRSKLSEIESAANRMVAAADKAIRAKAKIHSPSKLTDKYGGYFGEGWVNGILGMVRDARHAAEQLVSVPTVATPNLAFAGGFEMSADYDYYRNAQYVIEVPLAVDGREFAKATASYTEEELNRKQSRDYRKKGRT